MRSKWQAPAPAGRRVFETRTIEPIPDAERHGGLSSQFTLWLGANLQITAVVTGALTVVLGGDVFWSLVALLIGHVLGGAVMALHGAQGPQLGLPQMITSRAQFGVVGAVIPIALVCLMYVGFSASGTILAGQAMAQLLGVNDWQGIAVFSAVVAVLTGLGYRTIHWLGRLASVIGTATFLYMFVQIALHYDLPALLAQRHFSLPQFLLSLSLAASWQLAYGPYVADYSRYLPRSSSAAKTFLAIGLGSIVGSQISMGLGVFAAALAGPQWVHHEVPFIVGLAASGAPASLLFLSIVLGKLIVTTLNAYGSVMSLATVVSGFRGPTRFSGRARGLCILIVVLCGTVLAVLGRNIFMDGFTTFILFLLAAFTPWSAINLVDYYFITQSRYDIQALDDPHGCYGRWNLNGIAAYLVGIGVQLPFISTRFYTGPLVAVLGGIDISWLLGLAVPAVLYYRLARHTA